MNRQRFNQLLNNPSLVENSDIRQLNEYRKKYPYFQGLYVIVAKALRERDHPKTDAFIKKAAIYSANRTHLKSIIEGDDFFKPDEPSVKVVNSPKSRTETAERRVAGEGSTEAIERAQRNTNTHQDRPSSWKEENEEASFGDDPVINELRASKARIEALLRGEVPISEEGNEAHVSSKPVAKEVNSSKGPIRQRKSKQIEIIEKFLAEDPRIDLKQKAASEADQDQEDLAQKSMAAPEDFETETVAQLMIKQGKIKKGLSIYKKLSLKFPEKSSYFATQIEKVKAKHNV